jgi:hypothetical protein
MSQPFVYIGTFRLKRGRLDDFRASCREIVQFVETNEPRVIAFNFYGSEDGSEASLVQVHPDADSMLTHMRLLYEHIAEAYDEDSPIDVTTSVQVYGTPTDEVLEMIKGFGPDVPLLVKPHPIDGFTRSAAKQEIGAS